MVAQSDIVLNAQLVLQYGTKLLFDASPIDWHPYTLEDSVRLKELRL